MTHDDRKLTQILMKLREVPDDETAWKQLFRELWPFVLAVSFRRLHGNRELAEDVAQEVFLLLARASPFERLTSADALKAYVWRMIQNTINSYLRLSQWEPSTGLQVKEQAQIEPNLELGLWIDKKLADLSTQNRELIWMIAEGHSLADAAEATGLSYSAAGVRVHRLRKQLRDAFGD